MRKLASKEKITSLTKTNIMQDVFIVVAIFGALFGITYVVITARNRERLAMIEKGINPLEHKPKPNNTSALLKWALLIIGLGFGFFVGSLLENYTTIQEVAAYFSSVFFFGGLGLLTAYLIEKKSKTE
jgi:hypothetical protein